MTTTTHYAPSFVGTFPSPLLAGIFYISTEYNTCAHLCACGCGDEVVTPLSPAQWSFFYDGKDISVWPSVGSWSLPCRSHYYIEDGQVRWSRQYSDDEIARNRARDRAAMCADHRVKARGASTPIASQPAFSDEARDASGPLRRLARRLGWK